MTYNGGTRNTYVGSPDNMADRVNEAATKALEIEIREAIKALTDGRQGRFTATIMLLGAIIGEEE